MNTNKTLRFLIIFGLALLMTTPFVVSSELYFPFITGKVFFFRAITAIIFVLWVILSVRDFEYRPKKNVLLLSFTLFIVSIFISGLFGANFENSMFSRLERMEGFYTLINLYALFLVASSTMTKKINWDVLFNISIVMSVIMAFYGVMQLTGKIVINQGGVRLDGTLGNATYLAVYTLFNVFLTINYLVKSVKKIPLVSVYFIALVFQFITLYYTATRGAILGTIGGILVTLILIALLNKENKFIRNTSLYIGGVIILCVLIFAAISQTDFIRSNKLLVRFSNISLSERTVEARFMIWNSAWQGFKDRPIFGWGQGNFSYPFALYYSADQHEQEPWFDRAHNAVFDWLVAGGIIGLLLYLSLFISPLYLMWFKENDFSNIEKSVLTGLLSAYGFNNLFVFDNVISYIYFILILAYISSRIKSPKLFEKLNQRVGYIAITLVVILIPFQLYAFNYPAYKQAKTILSASTVFSRTNNGALVYRLPNGPLENLELFKKVFEYDSYGNREAIQSFVQTAGGVMTNDSVSLEVKNAYLNFGSSILDQFINRDKQNPLYYDLSARFHGTAGVTDKALEDINNAINISPNKQDFYGTKVRILFSADRKEEAMETAKFAYELQKENDSIWELYLTLAGTVGEKDLVQNLLKESMEIGEIDRVRRFADEQERKRNQQVVQ